MFNKHSGYRRKRFFFIPLVILAAVALFGAVVMLLWNAILPPVLGVAVLSYWQAVGLLVLCRILFGGFRGGSPVGKGRAAHWRGKWQNMSEEDRVRFKEAWRERCNKKPE